MHLLAKGQGRNVLVGRLRQDITGGWGVHPSVDGTPTREALEEALGAHSPSPTGDSTPEFSGAPAPAGHGGQTRPRSVAPQHPCRGGCDMTRRRGSSGEGS